MSSKFFNETSYLTSLDKNKVKRRASVKIDMLTTSKTNKKIARLLKKSLRSVKKFIARSSDKQKDMVG